MGAKADGKPVVRCLAAKPIYGTLGEVQMMQFIPQNAARFAEEAGWYVIRDPFDQDALDAWNRAHGQPFNAPRQPM